VPGLVEQRARPRQVAVPPRHVGVVRPVRRRQEPGGEHRTAPRTAPRSPPGDRARGRSLRGRDDRAGYRIVVVEQHVREDQARRRLDAHARFARRPRSRDRRAPRSRGGRRCRRRASGCAPRDRWRTRSAGAAASAARGSRGSRQARPRTASARAGCTGPAPITASPRHCPGGTPRYETIPNSRSVMSVPSGNREVKPHVAIVDHVDRHVALGEPPSDTGCRTSDRARPRRSARHPWR